MAIFIRSLFVGEVVKELRGHHSEVMTLQVDSEKVISAAGKIISIWDLETAKVNTVLEGHGGEVNCLQFDNKKVVGVPLNQLFISLRCQ